MLRKGVVAGIDSSASASTLATSGCQASRSVLRAWPYTNEMFSDDSVDAQAAAAGIGPARSALREGWQSEVARVLAEALLSMPATTPFLSTGTQGRHSEHMGYILAEMQVLQRQHPGGRW